MYKTHSTLIALAMISASCFHNSVAVHAPSDAQQHHQHGGQPHRPANIIVNSTSDNGSSAATSNQAEPLFVDLSGMLKGLAAKYNISSQTNNHSGTASRRSLDGRKRAAHPGCCG